MKKDRQLASAVFFERAKRSVEKRLRGSHTATAGSVRSRNAQRCGTLQGKGTQSGGLTEKRCRGTPKHSEKGLKNNICSCRKGKRTLREVPQRGEGTDTLRRIIHFDIRREMRIVNQTGRLREKETGRN